MIRKTISHYRIIEKLGEGGMGVVYKAEDMKLKRTVALKFLPPELTRDPEAKERFVHEAQAAAALNHPNICTIHEVDETEGQSFIVMEYLEGQSLKDKIEANFPKVLDLREILDIAAQVAQGLEKAHQKGIVHRDIKPANIFVTADGAVKILDFGLAKLRGQKKLTKAGTTVGTVAYMSPEQARGKEVDHRTDIWSLGVVLYEMLTGQRPFEGEYEQAVVYSIMNEEQEPPTRIRKEIPSQFEEIVLRALKKDLDERFQSVHELHQALESYKAETNEGASIGLTFGSIARVFKKPSAAIAATVLLCVVSLFVIRSMRHTGKVKWARNEALPAITDLVEGEEYYSAYQLALQAREAIPTDALLNRLWAEVTNSVSVLTFPPGAKVFIKEYMDPDSDWDYVGRSPLESIDLPRGFFRWRVQKDGYIPLEMARSSRSDTIDFSLHEIGSIPDGMVRVSGGRRDVMIVGHGLFHTAVLSDFLIDRFEVTNDEYQAFVDSGGYKRRELWKYDFIKDGKMLSWEEAMVIFRDKTGRPGPSTWELSTFPDGQGDLPVTGISWYEAAAYAEFASLKLPTFHHWISAASMWASAYIIPFSNFGKSGLGKVGSFQSLGYYGVYDMPGNAREWCFNATAEGRYIMGGCWSDPHYMFNFPSAISPFDRSPCNGFRCLKLLGESDLPDTTMQDISFAEARDYGKEAPVADELLNAYMSQYHYDRKPLNEIVEFMDDEPEHWRIEKISFDAAYGNERMFVYLFLPRGVSPPYQLVVLFPGAYALEMRSSENGRALNSFDAVDFVIRSGRAALCPVYKSTYERADGYSFYDPKYTSSDYHAHILMWWKDLSRSLDYLERRDDIDMNKLAYFGSSLGAAVSPIFLAQDDRYKIAVLRLGGLPTWEENPAFDPFNFAPQIAIPVLMINGKYDYIFPYENSQLPMFETLRTPIEDKRLVLFETGHSVYGHRTDVIREVLDWLDHYLGPVK